LRGSGEKGIIPDKKKNDSEKEVGCDMKVYMLRHGETDWNVEGRLQGQTDIPMNETGRKQIKEVGAFLKGYSFAVSKIISSPLSRTRETTKIVTEAIGYQNDVTYDELLMERGLGKLEGVVLSPEINWSDPNHCLETIETLCKRADQVVAKYAGQEDVLLVTHGGFIRALVVALTKGKIPYSKSAFMKQGDVLLAEMDENGQVEELRYLIGQEVFKVEEK